jgi:hypothetical protein
MKKGGLPDDVVRPYSEQEAEFPFRELVKSAGIGVPVVSIEERSRSTVIGTRGIVSSIGGAFHSVRFDDVVDLNVWDPEIKNKEAHEYLAATDVAGNKHQIWFP